MDADLAELCAQTVTTRNVVGLDSFSKPSYEQVAKSWAARIEVGEVETTNGVGAVVTAKGVAYLVPVSGQASPADGAQITLPTTYPASIRTLIVLHVDTEIDEVGGVDHYKVFFG
jgi:hypothetical protein